MPSRSVMSDSLQPHGPQAARFFCPWDFPDKNTGVSCHFLLQSVFLPISKYKSKMMDVCSLTLFLPSNTVRKEFVSKGLTEQCQHFTSNKNYLYYLSFILSTHNTLPSISGSPIETYLFCSLKKLRLGLALPIFHPFIFFV